MQLAELQGSEDSAKSSSKGPWLGGSGWSCLCTVAAALAWRKPLGVCHMIEWRAGEWVLWQTARASLLPQGTQIQVLREGHRASQRRTPVLIEVRALGACCRNEALHSTQQKRACRLQMPGILHCTALTYLDGDEYDIHAYPDKSCGPQNEKGIHRTNDH